MGIIKNYNDKKWTLQFLDALYNSIDWKSTFITHSKEKELIRFIFIKNRKRILHRWIFLEKDEN
jgi:hypothetical protein